MTTPAPGSDHDPDQTPEPPEATGEEGLSPGEQMARRLVQDVAAYEVDPPPPGRAEG